MAEDLRQFDRWVLKDDWPQVACPVCLVGHLVLDKVEAVTSPRSERAYNTTHLPGELGGTFHGLMKCALPACREPVVIAGDYEVDVNPDAKHDETMDDYADFFRLRFAAPAFKIISPPPDTPKTVLKAVESAAAIIWADPNAAANRLRMAIDELLTAYRMRRFRNINGKRLRISTHDRIKEFKKYEDEEAYAKR